MSNEVKIYMYNLDGKYIRSFVNLTEASVKMEIGMALLSKSSRGLCISAGRHRWTREFTEELEPLDTPVYEKEFYQYRMTGEYVDSFDNIDDLISRTETNRSSRKAQIYSIRQCLTGNRRNYQGFQWSTKRSSNIGKDMDYLSVYRRIVQKDLDGNYIDTYDSALSAVKSLGLKDSCKLSLGHAIRKEGTAKTYKGYKWEYVDENVN